MSLPGGHVVAGLTPHVEPTTPGIGATNTGGGRHAGHDEAGTTSRVTFPDGLYEAAATVTSRADVRRPPTSASIDDGVHRCRARWCRRPKLPSRRGA
jgi:hypothetical protein